MTAMDWIEADIATSTTGIEAVTGRLLELGIDGFVIKDPRDFQAFLDDKEGNWDYIDDDLMGLKDCETTVTVYIENNSSAPEMISAVRSELAVLRSMSDDFGRLELELKNIREQDWANNWKKYFKPLCVGEKLLIKPSWETVPENEKRKVVEIDPAASFGTGQHHTTQLCLELLEKNILPGCSLLDLGCGSGILSIAAMTLGATRAAAVDIDPNSVKIAAENAEKNSIPSDKYKTFAGNIVADPALVERIGTNYDVVCANIVADVLVAMSGLFGGFLKKGGKLVVSGIIDPRKDEVLDSIVSQGFELVEERKKDDWNAASFIYR